MEKAVPEKFFRAWFAGFLSRKTNFVREMALP